MTKAVPAQEFAASISFLLSQLGAESAVRFAEALTEVQITPRAFAVLAAVEAMSSPTQQAIADALGIHRNNMVALIDDMEAAGWVRRTRSTSDRRAFQISSTATGGRAVRRVNDVVHDLDDRLAGALTRRERGQLVGLLSRLADGAGLASGVHPHLGGRHSAR